MNVERMRAVAERIVADEAHFNMGRYFGAIVHGDLSAVPPLKAVDPETREFRCGCSGCFAGHAVAMFAKALTDSCILSCHDEARLLLELTVDQANALFAYTAPDKSLEETTAAETAAFALEMIARYRDAGATSR